jgi:hypothetical protein
LILRRRIGVVKPPWRERDQWPILLVAQLSSARTVMLRCGSTSRIVQLAREVRAPRAIERTIECG